MSLFNQIIVFKIQYKCPYPATGCYKLILNSFSIWYGCVVPTYVTGYTSPTVPSDTSCQSPNSGYNLANLNIPSLSGTFYCCNTNNCNTSNNLSVNFNIYLIILISFIIIFICIYS